MATWTKQPQEREGNYFFSGRFYVTRGVTRELSLEEIVFICQDLSRFVLQENGADYLQVYTDEQERKLFFIDQLSKEMIESGQFQPDDNYCTLLWSHEY